MATPTDATFGSDFDPTAFRQAIISSMEMGMPADAGKQATFVFSAQNEFDVQDPAGNPYNFTALAASSVPERRVVIPIAVEFVSRASLSDGTPWGEIETPKAIVTVLDQHFPEVDGADFILMDGAEYHIDYVAPPIGLFSVTIFQIYCSARDEA